MEFVDFVNIGVNLGLLGFVLRMLWKIDVRLTAIETKISLFENHKERQSYDER